MQFRIIQIAGLAFTIAYAVFIVWIYATEPRTFNEVATSVEVAAGTYQVNQESLILRWISFGENSSEQLATNGSALTRRKAMRVRSSISLIPSTAKAGAVCITTSCFSSKVWMQLIAPSVLHQLARLPWTIRTCGYTALRS